ncbi:MAG TPA: proteasome accessory factor PafA2 family protein [Candidatus Thermoplasmatota archaeon]|nr:proteasome accessory factor PafA2 family protein [Candidatus Thermoplasmatota archaeon]
MEPMVQGTEHEYTLFSHRMNPLGIDPHRLALEYIRSSDLSAGGEFLKNGSRAYFDVGHLEISTCETTNARDCLLWEKAGERIVDLARLKLENDHNVKISAYKNNTDPDGVSYGSHENYCISRELAFPDAFVKKLVPFLVSRIIYTGAGDVIEGRYVLSPCAYLTSQVVSGGNLYNTGILHTRDEPHGDPSRFRRLHVIIGDALMGEVPIWVRHTATALVLRAMEQDRIRNPPELKNPLEDMWRMVEMVDPLKWKLEPKEGKKTTPMEIQRYYLSEVEDLVTTKDEKEAFATWEWILTKMEKGDVKALSRKIEWMSRLMEVERMIDLKGRAENVELAAVKQYSEVSEHRSLYGRLLQEGRIDRVLTDQEIKRAIREPPSDTRALARVKILEDYEIASADWAEIRVLTEEGGAETIELPDPYSTKVPI